MFLTERKFLVIIQVSPGLGLPQVGVTGVEGLQSTKQESVIKLSEGEWVTRVEGLQSTKQDPVIKLSEGEWVTGAEGLQSTKQDPVKKIMYIVQVNEKEMTQGVSIYKTRP